MTGVNAVSLTNRPVHDIKKRWQDIKIKVRKDLDAHKRQLAQTGGGPNQDLHLHPWEEVVRTLMDEESLEGGGPVDHGASDTSEEDRPTTSRRAVAHTARRSWQTEDDGGAAAPLPPQPPAAPIPAAQPVVPLPAAPPGPAGPPAAAGNDSQPHVQQRLDQEGTIGAIQALVGVCAKPAGQEESQDSQEEGPEGGLEEAMEEAQEEGEARLPSAPALTPARTPTPLDWEGSNLGAFSEPSQEGQFNPRWTEAMNTRRPLAADSALREALRDMSQRLSSLEQQLGTQSQAIEDQATYGQHVALATEDLVAGYGTRHCAEALEQISSRLDIMAANQVAIAKRERHLTRQCMKACTDMAIGFLALTGQIAESTKAMVDLATALTCQPPAAPATPIRVPTPGTSTEPSTSTSNPPSTVRSPAPGVLRRTTRSGAHLPHSDPAGGKRGRK